MTLEKIILTYWWYWRVRFSCWRLGILSYHITPAPNFEMWECWKEFHGMLFRDRTKDSSVSVEEIDFTGRDEIELRKNYQRRYHLTKKELDSLHMAFSPYKVPKGLGYYEVKYYIEKYNHKKLFHLFNL